MKRKLIIISIAIIVVIASVFALSACNNRATTQGQLSNFLVDHNKEYFEYDVQIGGTSIGVYKVTVTSHLAHSVINCPDEKEVEKGVFVESELDVNYGGKHVVYNTGCYFNLVSGSSLMVPAYTYRIQTEDGVETFRMSGNYQGSTFRFEKKVGEEDPSNGSFKLSGTYFDNNEFHQSLRTVSTFSTNFSFTFTVPLVSETESTSASLTAKCSKDVMIKTAYTDSIPEYAETGVSCYKVILSRSTKVAGLSQTLYYAKTALKSQTATEFTMRNVLVEFHEPLTSDENAEYVSYCLKVAKILA